METMDECGTNFAEVHTSKVEILTTFMVVMT